MVDKIAGGKALRILFPLCAAASVLFIFANSAQVAEVSSGRSGAVTEWFNRGMAWMIEEHTVRKLGHLLEYALLGLWLMLSLQVYTHKIGSYLAWPLLLGLMTAVGDELFQLSVPGRSGQISDVAIDFCGLLVGLLLGFLLFRLLPVITGAVHSRSRRSGRQQ